MKRSLVFLCILVVCVSQVALFAATDVSLGAGGNITIPLQENIDLKPGYGGSVYLGVNDYISGYFDLIFIKPEMQGISLPSEVELKSKVMLISGALSYPFMTSETNTFKIGAGYSYISEEMTVEYMGETETLAEVETGGLCLVADYVSDSMTSSLRYIIPDESDNAQGLLILSVYFNIF